MEHNHVTESMPNCLIIVPPSQAAFIILEGPLFHASTIGTDDL